MSLSHTASCSQGSDGWPTTKPCILVHACACLCVFVSFHPLGQMTLLQNTSVRGSCLLFMRLQRRQKYFKGRACPLAMSPWRLEDQEGTGGSSCISMRWWAGLGSRVDGPAGRKRVKGRKFGLELAFPASERARERGNSEEVFYRAIKRPPSVSAPECRAGSPPGLPWR